MNRNTKIYIIVGVVIAIIVMATYYAFTNSTARKTEFPTAKQKSYSQQFCLNAVSNITAMRMATSSGVKCFRTDISLNESEASYVSNITYQGGSFLGILDYETVSAHPSTEYGCMGNCNWTLNEWNSSVANAVKEYPEVKTWEIWNEPLVPLFMDGYENGSAFNYYEMAKSASLIIKKNDPSSTIVCFGGAELAFNEQEYQFYSSAWGYGMSQYCDAISLHAYTGYYYNLNQSLGNFTLYQDFNFTLNLYENLTQKPIWITETGIPSNNWTPGAELSEQKQASFLSQDFSFFSNYPFVKRVYWFNLLGSTEGGADYGLLNATNLRPKPSWYSFLYFLDNSTNR